MNIDPKLTPRMESTLKRAGDLAVRKGHNYIGTEHLLLALLDDPHGVAGGVLHRLGVAESVRIEVTRVMDSYGSSGTRGSGERLQ